MLFCLGRYGYLRECKSRELPFINCYPFSSLTLFIARAPWIPKVVSWITSYHQSEEFKERFEEEFKEFIQRVETVYLTVRSGAQFTPGVSVLFLDSIENELSASLSAEARCSSPLASAKTMTANLVY
jgi:hypothetical protein